MTISFTKPGKARDITLVFLIVLGTLVYRRPDAFTHPQLWAEDGPLYLQQVEQYGFKSLLIPDGGYLHFVPRIIALFWSLLNVSYFYIPACYVYSAFFFTFFIALNIWKTVNALGIKHKILYATSFLLLPLGSDIFMNLTNINWIASLYLINFLFVRYSDNSNKNQYLNLIAITIISLSGPFSTLLSPVVFLSIIIERKSLTVKKTVPLFLILIGGIIQFIYIKFIDPGMYRGVPGTPEQYHLLMLITNNMRELLFLDYRHLQWISPFMGMIICEIVFVILTIIFIKAYRTIINKRKYMLVLYAIIVLCSFIQAYWPNESKVLWDNPRYYFIPFTCIGWLLILAFDKIIRPVYIGVYLLFFLLQHRYIAMVLPDKEWKKQISDYYAGKTRVIEINPDKWKIELPERK